MATFGPLLLVPWLLVLILTPLLIRVAHRRGWLDQPDARKQHDTAIPIVGGVSVFLSIFIGVALVMLWSPELQPTLWGQGSLLALSGGVLATVLLGLYDDFNDMRPNLKLLGQILIAMGAWVVGFRIGAVELPFGMLIQAGGLISLLLTVGWIVMVTNAFNLMDGMDGLASGISIVIALTVFLLAHGNGASVPIIAALALSGALAGFLRFNLPPARIFLGDAGAMGIGFTTAVLTLASYQKSTAAVALIVPLLILGLPLIDTIHAALRRAIAYARNPGEGGLSPIEAMRAMFRADRGHVHHLLLRSGLSVQQTLLALYLVTGALGVLGLWTRTASSSFRWGLWLALVVAGYTALQMLERRVIRRENEAQAQAEEPPAVETSKQRAAG